MGDKPTPTRRWAEHATGPAGPASLAALSTVDPTALTGPELIDAILAAEKGMSLLAAVQMRLMAAFAVPFVAGDPTRLAARLAKKNRCPGTEQDNANIQPYITEAATSLAAAEVAAALRIAPVTGGIRVRAAGTITTVLAPTLHALQTGVLDRGKARVIADHCEPLQPEHTAAVQELVLTAAGALTTSELRELTGLAVITVDPDGAQDRHDHAAARRDLALTAHPDAMATLKAFLPADAAVKIFQISDLLATGTAGTTGDNRGIGARRIDALVDIADQLLTHGHLNLTHYLSTRLPDHGQPCPHNNNMHSTNTTDTTDTGTAETDAPAGGLDDGNGNGNDASTSTSTSGSTVFTDDTSNATSRAAANNATSGPARNSGAVLPAPTGGPSPSFTRQGRRPHLTVTIALSTLAGHDQRPGSLAGYGAIPAGLARSIAASAATITAISTDPTTGAARKAGQLTYRPRQDLRDQVTAINTTCQFPSCRQPAWRCDIDHRDPFDHTHPDQGGPTTADNTSPACRRHHLFKHHTAWKTRVNPADMVIHWTSPTGHGYTKPPRPAAPPHIWTTHPGTGITEHLETITSTATTLLNPPPVVLSNVEEALVMLLLQHHLNRRPTEWDPNSDPWPSHPTADPHAADTIDDIDDDTPPF